MNRKLETKKKLISGKKGKSFFDYRKNKVKRYEWWMTKSIQILFFSHQHVLKRP